MNTKRLAIIIAAILVVAIAAGVVWSRRGDQEPTASATQGSTYYCPMHPTITSDKPGNCPICGMKLVKRSGSGQSDVATQLAASGKIDPSVAAISISPAQRVMANVKTMRVVSGATSQELVTTGRVTFDERRMAQVTAYAAGRIEQLYANFTGDAVRRGGAVATIYSPDLYATQQEYLLALANRERMRRAGFAQARAAADDLVESTRRRLQLFGVSKDQIDRLAREGRPSFTTTIVSPVSGIVTRKLVVPQQYVVQGQTLLEVADLSTVWVEADVFENQLSRIAPGQRVSISAPALPGFELPGRVAFINPVVAGESRATRVRIELPNRNLQLKPDMYVSVKLFSSPAEAGATSATISIPATAVIDRGQQQFVWIEVSPGAFSARLVRVGSRSADRVEILSGLSTGETIVIEGAFLLDSEAQLRSAAPQGT